VAAAVMATVEKRKREGGNDGARVDELADFHSKLRNIIKFKQFFNFVLFKFFKTSLRGRGWIVTHPKAVICGGVSKTFDSAQFKDVLKDADGKKEGRELRTLEIVECVASEQRRRQP
jgi:streptomycin 6-kinase